MSMKKIGLQCSTGIALLVSLLLGVSSARGEEQALVTIDAEGKAGPGLAVSWEVKGENVVRFVLAEGVCARKVAEALTEKLTGLEVTHAHGAIEISGLEEGELLKKLAGIPMEVTKIEPEKPACETAVAKAQKPAGEAAAAEAQQPEQSKGESAVAESATEGTDPLAALGSIGMGGAIALAAPDSGSSIRARKPVRMPDAMRQSDPENFVAKVLSVVEDHFPLVTIRLKVLRGPKEGKLAKQLKKRRKIKARPVFDTQGKQISFDSDRSIINTGAYFLRRGDIVYARAVGKEGDVFLLDYVERK